MSRVRGFFKDIPVVGSYSTLPPVLSRGSLVFLTTDQKLYMSNGQAWAPAGGNIAPLEAQVATNTANIATLQTDVTTLQGQVATNTTNITTLQGQVATNTTSINNILLAQSVGFTISDGGSLRTFTAAIARVDVATVSPTPIYTLFIPLNGGLNDVYLIQWNILAHYQTANVFYAVGQSSVLSNGLGGVVSVFGTTTNQTNSSGASAITVTADFDTVLNEYRLIVTSNSAVITTYSGYVIVTRILSNSP
uniref:Uncharacterized protein n=1 Tax=Marseillevirus sp. TaxID=2809551 RepID=A0AA96ES15_9VIRU|nr:hypothetical protein MarFTMF_506 [Marseillevirus sp.]